MMPQPIEILESNPRPHCTREQARALLQGLLVAYRSLSTAERFFVKSFVSQMSRKQDLQELE
jgi:hypothetical protein